MGQPGISVNNHLGASDHGIINGNTMLNNGGPDIALKTDAGGTVAYSVSGNVLDGANGSIAIQAGCIGNLITGNVLSMVPVLDKGTNDLLANNG